MFFVLFVVFCVFSEWVLLFSTSLFAKKLGLHGYEMKTDGKIAQKAPSEDFEQKKKRLEKRHIGSTPGFTAPELLVLNDNDFFRNRNSFAVDVYSVGMTLLCFLAKSSPFLDMDYRNLSKYQESKAIKTQVRKEIIDPLVAKCWSDEELQELRELSLFDVVYRCLDFDPNTRITSAQALEMMQGSLARVRLEKK